MKKIFLVERTNEIDYEKYDSCVVIAESEEDILDIIKKSESYWDYGKRKIIEISLDECDDMILLSSFNS